MARFSHQSVSLMDFTPSGPLAKCGGTNLFDHGPFSDDSCLLLFRGWHLSQWCSAKGDVTNLAPSWYLIFLVHCPFCDQYIDSVVASMLLHVFVKTSLLMENSVRKILREHYRPWWLIPFFQMVFFRRHMLHISNTSAKFILSQIYQCLSGFLCGTLSLCVPVIEELLFMPLG